MNVNHSRAHQPVSLGLASAQFSPYNTVETLCPQFDLQFPAVHCNDRSSFLSALVIGYLRLNEQSESPRWITVVTTEINQVHRYKALFGLDSHLRIISAKADDILWISWQCLAQGNSFAVISLVDHLTPGEDQHLIQAAQIGQCAYHAICEIPSKQSNF